MELGGTQLRRAKVGGRGGTEPKRKREKGLMDANKCGDCGKGGWRGGVEEGVGGKR